MVSDSQKRQRNKQRTITRRALGKILIGPNKPVLTKAEASGIMSYLIPEEDIPDYAGKLGAIVVAAHKGNASNKPDRNISTYFNNIPEEELTKKINDILFSYDKINFVTAQVNRNGDMYNDFHKYIAQKSLNKKGKRPWETIMAEAKPRYNIQEDRIEDWITKALANEKHSVRKYSPILKTFSNDVDTDIGKLERVEVVGALHDPERIFRAYEDMAISKIPLEIFPKQKINLSSLFDLVKEYEGKYKVHITPRTHLPGKTAYIPDFAARIF